MAVAHLVASPKQFYRFWRISFIDFIGAMLGFWVTLFTSTEIGLAVAVGFCLVYTLLRLAFPRWIGLSHHETGNDHVSLPSQHARDVAVPPEAYLVQYTDDLLFSHAERIKVAILDDVKVHFEPSSAVPVSTQKTWNPSTKKRIVKLRARRGITAIDGDVVELRRVVLDFGMVSFLDTTGVFSLTELKMELRRYIGQHLEFRFVNMCDAVRERLGRAGWVFARAGEQRAEDADVICSSIELALYHDGGDDKEELVQEKTMDA